MVRFVSSAGTNSFWFDEEIDNTDAAFRNEEGELFRDDLKNYTHIVNKSGKVMVGGNGDFSKPDLSLKQYVVNTCIKK